jgi:hypothetical protein
MVFFLGVFRPKKFFVRSPMRTILRMLLVLSTLVASGCGDAFSPGDGSLSCATKDDCQPGFICFQGQCVDRPPCTDLDGDGYCDRREGYDDCNDNRADIHPGAEERCDGIDNNCDGRVDEGCPCESGESQACGSNVGVCRAGQQTCVRGEWGPCEGGRGPDAEETCDDLLDNDCNGAVDDGCGCEPGSTRDCGSHLGDCTPGIQVCGEAGGAWAWSECQGGTPPQAEVCGDGIDNDCDGALDNGCTCDEDRRPCGLNVGTCQAGIQNCVHGVWRGCEGARWPEDERCDGLDNDCDHLTDEGCECLDGQFEACGADTGECRQGTRICESGLWGRCEGEVRPVAELCDGRDNDCDGAVDEDFPDLRAPCSAGLGICERPGVWVCTEDKTGLRCSANAGQGYAELCNGLDDDCDGLTDEDFPGTGTPCTVGQGECQRSGINVCGQAGGVACNVQPGMPAFELCDGLDNDCDGFTDENFPLLGAACSAGLGQCRQNGRYVCAADGSTAACDATPLQGQPETCNGRDDDCDGQVDEDFPDLGQPCQAGEGSCLRLGIRICTADGLATRCSASPGPSGSETCNGLDDDCDGIVDNNVPGTGGACQRGQGACFATGQLVCLSSGDIACDAPVLQPQNERCDGVDNDCDGFVDEVFSNLGLACSVGVGACYRTGTWVCAADGSGTVCNAPVVTGTAEQCNGIDDNCNGQVDEGWSEPCATACGTGFRFCVNGQPGVCSAPQPAANDSYCNDYDDDCDGLTDEDVPNKGAECSVGTGGCRGLGYLVCNTTGGTVCNAVAGTPMIENKNYNSGRNCTDLVDNDCDGLTDSADPGCQ